MALAACSLLVGCVDRRAVDVDESDRAAIDELTVSLGEGRLGVDADEVVVLLCDPSAEQSLATTIGVFSMRTFESADAVLLYAEAVMGIACEDRIDALRAAADDGREFAARLLPADVPEALLDRAIEAMGAENPGYASMYPPSALGVRVSNYCAIDRDGRLEPERLVSDAELVNDLSQHPIFDVLRAEQIAASVICPALVPVYDRALELLPDES